MLLRAEESHYALRLEASMTVDQRRSGKIGWVVLWLLGIPIPILLILFLIRGCT
jgi:hypothetical protein